MIYIKIRGGLGNQLFQYAAAKAVAIKYDDQVVLDVSGITDLGHNIFSLNNFNIENLTLSKDVKSFRKFISSIFQSLSYRIGVNISYNLSYNFDKFSSYFINIFGIYNVENGYVKLKKSLFKDKYMSGYFQSAKYFEEYSDIIKKELKVSVPLAKSNKAILDEIKDTNSVYERLGCGFKIASNVEGIPRGSGLGTSSILSAAILKALYKFIGIKIVDAKLCDNVLRLEQLMSTGGGWQDQVGGVIKGIKLISSNPGNVQKLEINKPKLSKETIKELNDRMLLIYSGQRRLARNLLRNIVKKYISNDPTTLKSLTKIQEIAVQMVNSLESGNIVKFSELMNEHMLISRKIDKGCVNEGIMEIINSIKKLVLSTFIMGAGGGGYILIMLKDGYNSDDIDSILEKKFPNTNIKSLKISIES